VSKGSDFELVPLNCPQCGASVDADSEDVVFYCVACRNGYRFDEESRRLESVEVAFVSAPHVATRRYAPFWALDARVLIEQRTSGGVDPVQWLARFFSADDSTAEPHSKGKGTFIVPAFDTALDATLDLTRRYTAALPQLGERLGEKLTGGRYGVEDARKLAHFAVIAAEVEKRDTLRHLRYRIDFGDSRLLGVPLVVDGEIRKDGLFGIEV
jgi:hypothetical protein